MEISIQKKYTSKKVFLAVIGFIASFVGLYALLQYASGFNSGFLRMKQGMELSNTWKSMLILHALAGGIALTTGWVQFMKRIRETYPALHRRVGLLFYASGLTGGFAGLYVAFFASGGNMAKAGFAAVAIAWIGALSMALIRIKQHDITSHEKWAYRGYAITFAAVTLRFYTTLTGLFFGVEKIMDFYPYIAWLCWIPNLVFIEWYISRKS